MRGRYSGKSYPFVFVLLICGCLFWSGRTEAQTIDSSKTYHVYLEPYLFAASMSGTTGIGTLPDAFVCIPASKVLEHLKIGGMLYAEVHNNQFAFTSDIFYANLDQNVSPKIDKGILNGTVSLTQFWWELAALYKVLPWFEVGVGARVNSIKSGVNININGPSGTVNKNKEQPETWVDPIIVTRLKGAINNKWLFQLRADIGGFGVGSKLAWQLQPTVFFRASRLLDLGLGYRAIYMDYNKGTGDQRFLYNMTEYGPQLKIGFNL
jgi:hypothetical protein